MSDRGPLDQIRIVDSDTKTTIYLSSLRRFHLERGEILIARVPKDAAKYRIVKIKQVLENLFPKNKVVICPDDVQITKITQEMLNANHRERRGAAEAVESEGAKDPQGVPT